MDSWFGRGLVGGGRLTVPPEIIRREIIWGLIIEVIDEPAVAEGAVGDVSDAEFLSCADEVVCFVDGFEGGVFGLEGVDFGDCVYQQASLMFGLKKERENLT